MVSDKKAVKKLKRLAMKKGDEDSRYSPELLSKSLLRSKYCEATPSECNTLVKVDEDVAMKDVVEETVEDEDVDMIRDSPTSVSDVKKLESNETHIIPDAGVWNGKLNKKGEAHGYGVFKFESGAVYEGNLKDGECHGKGKISNNGAAYEGDWKDGEWHGKGKVVSSTGHIYEGDFVHFEKTGKGKTTFKNGEIYEGDFKNGKKNGKGKYTFINGAVYEGDWKHGKRNGKGKMSFPGGRVHQGNFKNDRPHGEGIVRMKNGDLYENTYENGKRIKKKLIANIKGNVALAGGKSKKKTRKRKYKKRKTNKRKLRKKKTKRRKSTRKTKRKRKN